MKTKDIDIRNYLHRRIKNEYKNDGNTLVIDELNLCQGDARIDIAVINGALHGYEIKSESDTLERLPNQINVYSKVMDTVTIVVGKCHAEKVIDMVPNWWGISVTSMNMDNEMYFSNIRHPSLNPDIDPLSVAQLLWREEAINILKYKNLHKGYLSKPRNILWERLATYLPLDELRDLVRMQLKNRKAWRVGRSKK